jgi:hypothetical protein
MFVEMRVHNISVREQDEPTWNRALELAAKRDLPFSRFVTRALRIYVKSIEESRETPEDEES